MKICTFAGHAQISNQEEIELRVKKEATNLIKNENVTKFYNGCKGNFDMLCAKCVYELKKEYPFIKSCWVEAYIAQNKNVSNSFLEIFDESFYPNIRKSPTRFAIVKRNEWMIDNSDFLIAYVKHNLGSGASKTLQYAKKSKKIKVINIGEKF